MNWIVVVSIGALVAFSTLAVLNSDTAYLRAVSGIIALLATCGAGIMFLRKGDVQEIEDDLTNSNDYVSAQQRALILSTLNKKDRYDQLSLIVLAAVSTALQSAADMGPILFGPPTS